MKRASFQLVWMSILTLFWILTGLQGLKPWPVEASTTRLEFRVRQVESKLSRLESQISRLRNAPASVSPVIEVSPPNPAEQPQTSVELQGRQSWISGDPLFDRLATMVIELKQDIQDLQERVKDLES